MFRGYDIRPEDQAILVARIKQRVKEVLPDGWQLIGVSEIPCADSGCMLRVTRIAVRDMEGNKRYWSLHAPLSLVTAKEIAQVAQKHLPASGTPFPG
jgi:translation elongation factor EF-1beta